MDMHEQPTRFIQIIQIPAGEAPLEIRRAWIGMILPLVNVGDRSIRSYGVLSGPKGWWEQFIALVRGRGEPSDGYVVEARGAIDRLSRHAPAAARWWRERAPHLLRSGSHFVFDRAACEEVTEVEPGVWKWR